MQERALGTAIEGKKIGWEIFGVGFFGGGRGCVGVGSHPYTLCITGGTGEPGVSTPPSIRNKCHR